MGQHSRPKPFVKYQSCNQAFFCPLFTRNAYRQKFNIVVRRNSSHRGEHLFLLQTNTNSDLPTEISVGQVEYINSGIALIPASGTSIGQLEEHKLRSTQTLGAYRMQQNEKWAKNLVREM